MNLSYGRKYSLNKRYFKIIDSEDKAYWLGFITADGTVYKGGLRIMLQLRDKDHLCKFASAIGSNSPIRERSQSCNGKQHKTAHIAVYSKDMLVDLFQYGIVENKTSTVKPPNISSDLLPAYWRGILDGDGCIDKQIRNDRKKPCWRIHLINNYFVVSEFKSFVCSFSKTQAKISNKGKACEIWFGGNKIAGYIVKKLYKGANIYLERKYNLAQELFSTE